MEKHYNYYTIMRVGYARIDKILLGFLLIVSFSCTNKTYVNVNSKYNNQTDTTIISPSSFIEKTINVGDHITNNPLSSQIINFNNCTNLVLLDENKIYQFNWDTGMPTDTIVLKDMGNLNNYSGFNYCSEDSLILYNYSQRTIYISNAEGRIISKLDLNSQIKGKIDIEAINGTRPEIVGDKLILSGGKFGDTHDEKMKSHIVSVLCQFKPKMSISPLIEYPQIYKEGYWGGVYMNSIYHAIDNNGFVYYSFPIDHNVYRYDLKTGKTTSFYMGSRYTSEIKSCSDDFYEHFLDKDKRIDYYVKQHSYSYILYDKFRNVIIRIAEHPLHNYSGNSMFSKPFSVIIADVSGNILSESTIFTDCKDINLTNMHIVGEGLAINVKDKKNENLIKYRCYNINLK